MTLKKEKMLPIFTIIILSIGTISNIYVNAQKPLIIDSNDTLIINGVSTDINDLFSMMQLKTIETDEGEKIGISLDEIIQNNGITGPSGYSYTLIALDGYQQTVIWDYMQNGILTEDCRVFFEGLPHAFWVRDVIEIKVD
jgi:hypothetical protein